MRIVCSNCGLRYDPGLQNGVCPYCGCRSDPKQAAAPGSEQSGPGPMQQPAENGPADSAPPRARKKTGLLPATLCALFWLALMVETKVFPTMIRSARQQALQDNFVPPAAVRYESQNAPFAFGPHQRQLTIGGAQTLPGMQGVEPGAVMVRVWCTAKEMQDSDLFWATDAFLQADGAFYPAESGSAYDRSAGQFVQRPLPDIADPNDLWQGSKVEGWLYFVVPEGAETVTLWLQSGLKGLHLTTKQVEMTGVALIVQEGSVGGL